MDLHIYLITDNIPLFFFFFFFFFFLHIILIFFFFFFFLEMTSIFHSGLSKDFSLILKNADDFNVIIQVGENQNAKEFRAHSVILRARSPYFKSAFSSNWLTKKNGMIVFNKPNITPTVFDIILK